MEGLHPKKIISIIELIKETHRALSGNDDDFYVIPDDPLLIRQELLLVEMDDTELLGQFTDNDLSMIRASFLIPWADSIEVEGFIRKFLNNSRPKNAVIARDIPQTVDPNALDEFSKSTLSMAV